MCVSAGYYASIFSYSQYFINSDDQLRYLTILHLRVIYFNTVEHYLKSRVYSV